jgi:hypothetical protein
MPPITQALVIEEIVKDDRELEGDKESVLDQWEGFFRMKA